MCNPKKEIIVIGAGPAGIMAAITAAELGCSVSLLERSSKIARKLLAAGGGRANVTNALPNSEFIEKFDKKGRFIISAISEFSSKDLLDKFDNLGVPCEATDGFHYFPVTNKATDIVTALNNRLSSLGVKVIKEITVDKITKEDDRFNILLSTKKVLSADSVIIATGGVTFPKIGGDQSGYGLAKSLGHTIVPPVFGMVGLKIKEGWVKACSGIVLPNTELKICSKAYKKRLWNGDLLFTHKGISGPVILDSSSTISRLLLTQTEVELRIKLIGLFDTDAQSILHEWRNNRGSKLVRNLLSAHLPKKVAIGICEECGISADQTASAISKKSQLALIDTIDQGIKLTVTGTDGINSAMVTAGGVGIREVHSGKMASRLVEGLYFAGEIVDIDGPCGGYNLQWAFSSGYLAGKSAAQDIY